MFGSNVADLQQFVLLHLKINFASIATGNPIQDNAAEVLSRLYQGGVRMSERHKQAIRLGGIDIDRSETPQKTVRTDGRAHLWLFPEQAEAAKARKKDPQEKAEAYLDRVPLAVKQQWASVQISRNDWVPESIDSHTPEFRDFIKSHFPRFDRLKFYLKFYLYIEQARRWMAEHQVPVVIEIILERVTNIAMGTEIDNVTEFEELASGMSDAPTAVAASMLD